MSWFDWYVQVAISLSALLAWSFVARYALCSPWRSNVVGRSLMYVWLSLAVILTLIATTYIFGAYPGRTAVRAVVYTTLPFALGKFLVVLVRVQQGRERGEIPAKVQGEL